MIYTLTAQCKNDLYQGVLKSRVWQTHGSKLGHEIQELRFVPSSETIRTTVSCHWGHWQINRADGSHGSKSRILLSLKSWDIKCIDMKLRLHVCILRESWHQKYKFRQHQVVVVFYFKAVSQVSCLLFLILVSLAYEISRIWITACYATSNINLVY